MGVFVYFKKIVKFTLDFVGFVAARTNKKNDFFGGLKRFITKRPVIFHIFLDWASALSLANVTSSPEFVRIINVIVHGHNLTDRLYPEIIILPAPLGKF
jgi:hypothetical protein